MRLRPLFRDTLRYDDIRIHRRRYLPWQPARVAMAPDGHVYFPPAAFREDFAAAGIDGWAWFVHEMVHVWQHQNRVFLDLRLIGLVAMLRGDYLRRGLATGRPGRRLYEVPPGCDAAFLELGYEQQASLVEAHVRAGASGTAPTSAAGEFLADPGIGAGRRSRVVLRR